MNYRDRGRAPEVIRVSDQATDAIVAPTDCPFCNSADITTTSKAVGASTYWRCTACGQIWNAGRLHHTDIGHRPFGSVRRIAGSRLHGDARDPVHFGANSFKDTLK